MYLFVQMHITKVLSLFPFCSFLLYFILLEIKGRAEFHI